MPISIADYMRSFEGLANEGPQYMHQPSIEERKLSKNLCSLLKVSNDATKAVSSSKYPTININFHLIWEVKEILGKGVNVIHLLNVMK